MPKNLKTAQLIFATERGKTKFHNAVKKMRSGLSVMRRAWTQVPLQLIWKDENTDEIRASVDGFRLTLADYEAEDWILVTPAEIQAGAERAKAAQNASSMSSISSENQSGE